MNSPKIMSRHDLRIYYFLCVPDSDASMLQGFCLGLGHGDCHSSDGPRPEATECRMRTEVAAGKTQGQA